MSDTSLWSRLRQARIFQFLIVYLGAAWVLIQVLDIFIDNLGLPAWTLVGALGLLGVGLVIILATAWVEALSAASHREEKKEAAEAEAEEGEEAPGGWDVAPADIKASIARGEFPRLTWGRAVLGGVFAFALLFGFAGLYVLLAERPIGDSGAPAATAGTSAAPGIAVLPFTVSGEALEDLREGMVNLLSTDLDGAGSLRAIDSRTVFARWDELVGIGRRADQATSLAVARAAGGRYAVLGSATAVGADVRLVAEVFEVATADRLGRGQVEGSPDSVLALVDQLSIEIMGLVLEGEGEPPSTKLSDVTTTSLDALKAYLEGESAYRIADFETAQAAYERAISADSNFALAHFQLSNTWGWSAGPFHEEAVTHRGRAVALADRLPARQALLVQATDEIFRFERDAIDKLRGAVERYPDDAFAWYLLGDAYFHLGVRSLASPREMDRAFRRAVELDPRFAPFQIHLLDLALPLRDSALAAERIERYAELAPASQFLPRSRLAYQLTFGDSVTRSEALDAVEALPADQLNAAASGHLDACCWHAKEPILEELRERGLAEQRAMAAQSLAAGWLSHGQVERSLEAFSDSLVSPVGRACNLSLHLSAGMPLQSPELDRRMELGELGDDYGALPFCKGVYAAAAGRWDDVDRVIAHYEGRPAAVDSAAAGPRAAGAEFAAHAAKSLRGYRLWKQGQPEQALALVEQAFLDGGLFSFWLGEIYEEVDRLEEAARFYAAFYNLPIAYYRLGKVYEQLGELEKALDAFETFIAAWEDADPELQPWVEESVERILNLSDRLGVAE